MHKKCVLQNYKEAQQLVVCQYQKTYWKRNPEITKYFSTKCDALRDLVPFAQFKKRENHPWGSVNFSKVAGWSLQLFKINTPPWVFFTLLKLCKWYQIAQRTTNVILKPVHTNASIYCFVFCWIAISSFLKVKLPTHIQNHLVPLVTLCTKFGISLLVYDDANRRNWNKKEETRK